MKIFLNAFLFLLFFSSLQAQQADSIPALASSLPTRSPHYSQRQWIVGSLSVAGYGGSLIALNKAWYKNYPKSSFHTFNDVGEWLQMDKAGHMWTAYTNSRISTALWKWAGLPENKAVWVGSLSGFTYMTVIEFLDGHSAEWGWSWGDMAANFSGSALFAVQQIHWKQQRLQYKFSSHKNNYDGALEIRANNLFGQSLPERILKDYNAQTYWLSFNLKSFFPPSHLPEWLGLSAGYGAGGMFGGYENIAYDKSGNLIFNRPDIKRYRQWYLSPDVDFTKIKTRSHVLRTVFSALNCLKFPAPALEFSKGKIKGHWLLF